MGNFPTLALRQNGPITASKQDAAEASRDDIARSHLKVAQDLQGDEAEEYLRLAELVSDGRIT